MKIDDYEDDGIGFSVPPKELWSPGCINGLMLAPGEMHDTSILGQTAAMTPAEIHRAENAAEQVETGDAPRTRDQDRRLQLDRKLSLLDPARAAARPAGDGQPDQAAAPEETTERGNRTPGGEKRPPGKHSTGENADIESRGGAPPAQRDSSGRGEYSGTAASTHTDARADTTPRAPTERATAPDARSAVRWAAREAPPALERDDPRLTPRDTDNSPERLALRQKIVTDLLGDVQPPERGRPALYLLGGGGGSGKSRLAAGLTEKTILPAENVVRLDPDDVKRRIPEFEEIRKLRDPRAADVVHEESSTLTRQAFAEALDRGVDIIFDSVLADAEKGIARIDAAKARGYQVHLYGAIADVETAIQRAMARGEETGRYVPVDRLLAAHRGFAEAFDRYIDRVDTAVLFDTNGDEKVIAVKELGGEFTIVDQTGWQNFLRKRDINPAATGPASLYGDAGPHSTAAHDQPPRDIAVAEPKTVVEGDDHA
ncbi:MULTISPECIES: zeta toxin family protein [Frankia]|uniref:zeta toxin family protein n=1 Tax=Frankia TaxID=1854 RepID=UPI0012FD44AC|nr:MULTISPECIES: zeta toxin family protein [Frankia]